MVDLFACLPVTDLPRAEDWYGRLLGVGPAFRPNDAEAVWEVAEHGYLYAQLLPEHAGHGRLTLFVEDLDERMTAVADRGLEPALRETYDNGVRKITYRDPDGNEIGFGGTAT